MYSKRAHRAEGKYGNKQRNEHKDYLFHKRF
jgi:hypothetical protein